MHTRACKNGEFTGADLDVVQAAIRLAGLDARSLVIKSGKHYLNINNSVEIQPLLFDCRGLLDTPSWIVRYSGDTASSELCSCGVTVRGGEIGTYTGVREAIAAAVAEVVRFKLLAELPRSAASSEAANSTHPNFNKESVNN
jgi:hypothetical protein